MQSYSSPAERRCKYGDRCHTVYAVYIRAFCKRQPNLYQPLVVTMNESIQTCTSDRCPLAKLCGVFRFLIIADIGVHCKRFFCVFIQVAFINDFKHIFPRFKLTKTFLKANYDQPKIQREAP